MINKTISFSSNTISTQLTKEMIDTLGPVTIPYLKLTSADDPLSKNYEYALNNSGDKLVITQTVTESFNGAYEQKKFTAHFHKKTIDSWTSANNISEISISDDFESNCYIQYVVTKKGWYQKGLSSFLLKTLIHSFDSAYNEANFKLTDISTVLINKMNEPLFGAFIYIKPAIESNFDVEITVSGIKDKNTGIPKYFPGYTFTKSSEILFKKPSYLMDLNDIDNEIQAVMDSNATLVTFTVFTNDRNRFNETGQLNCNIHIEL